MRTLAQRVDEDGPLPARDAVRLLVRVAKTLELLHEAGEVHGRLGPAAIALPGARTASARLRRPGSLPSGAGEPTRDDDTYGLALTLYFALTGSGVEGPRGGKLPPLAVFDAGDDALDAILSPALSPGLAGLRDLSALRRELEQWLDDPHTAAAEPLPWEDVEPTPRRIDLSSLPPPPQPAPRAPSQPDEDERETIPGDSPAPQTQRPPRIVPPKIALKRSQPPPLPASEPSPAPRSDVSPAPASKPAAARPLWPIGAAAGAVLVAYALLRDPSAPGSPPVEPRPSGAASDLAAAPGSQRAAASALASAALSVPPKAPPLTSSAAALPSSSTAAAPASASLPPVEVGACLQRALPADTFASTPTDVAFVCEEADVVKGAGRLRTRIVLGGDGRGVTEGMKQWSLLGGYELAAYAAIRSECCPGAAPAVAPGSPASCAVSMQDAVRQVAAARAASTQEVDAATGALDRALRCVVRAKQAAAFGGHPRPSGGEGTVLKQIFKRLASGAR